MMDTNPWQVDSIQEFYFLKCPECSFDTKEEKHFHEHALQNHPLSIVFFGTKSEELFEANIEIPEDHIPIKSENVEDMCLISTSHDDLTIRQELPEHSAQNFIQANESSTPSQPGGTIHKLNKQYLSQKAVEVI